MRERRRDLLSHLTVGDDLHLQLVEDRGDVGQVVGLPPPHGVQAGVAELGLLVPPGRQTGRLDVFCNDIQSAYLTRLVRGPNTTTMTYVSCDIMT